MSTERDTQAQYIATTHHKHIGHSTSLVQYMEWEKWENIDFQYIDPLHLKIARTIFHTRPTFIGTF